MPSTTWTELTDIGAISEDFQSALDHISTVSDKETRTRYSELKDSIETIHTYAENRGLPNEVLAALIETIVRPHLLDQHSQSAVIKSLYPAERVSNRLLWTVINSLGHGTRKASQSTQQILLQWVIMVYDYLEDQSTLSGLYNVLFNLLDATYLRTNLCHLLARITRKKHVRPFRIETLRNLSTTVGSDPPLLRLVQVFNKYVPEALDVAKSNKRLGDFSHPDPNWGFRLARIQSELDCQPIPSDAKEYVDRVGRTTVSELKPADLKDTTVQWTLALSPDEADQTKVDDCLSPVFDSYLEKLSNGQSISKQLFEILDCALSYTKSTKVSTSFDIVFLTTQPCRSYHNLFSSSSKPTSPSGIANKTRP